MIHSRPATTLVALGIGAATAVALASCTAILGIDESFVQASGDGSVTGTPTHEGADGSSPGPDATPPDAMPSPEDAGPPGDGGGGIDGGAAAWHVDRSFGDAGYVVLPTPPFGAEPAGMTVLTGPDGGLLVVALSSENAVIVYTLEGAPTLVQTFPTSDTQYGGALLSADGGLTVVTVADNHDVTVHAIAPSLHTEVALAAPQNNFNYARLVDQDASLHLLGSVGDLSDPDVPANLYVSGSSATSVDLPSLGTEPMTLAKATTTLDGSVYYGGICDTCPTSTAAYTIVGPGSKTSAGNLANFPSDGSGITDFAIVDGQVFAVGYADTAFMLSPLPRPDGGTTPLGLIPTSSKEGFYYSNSSIPILNTGVQLVSAVDAEKRIVVAGTFDEPLLAAFRTDGSADTRAFAEPTTGDAGAVYRTVLDLSEYLSGSPWFFQAMLLAGDVLWVALSSQGGGEWVVFRLVDGPLAP